jgi:dipeptide/tripeptide permease
MNTLDFIIYSGIAILAVSFVYIIWNYAKGLKDSPRELYLLFFTQIIEYVAYGAINMAFVLFLSADVGLGDVSAGSYIGVWSMFLTVTTMLVGAVVDAIGIKRTLLIGGAVTLFARLCLPISTNIYMASALAFIPMAIGMGMMQPVLSVGIKKYTTKETAALGFGLFYTIMNVGWALGARLFDAVRSHFGEHAMVRVFPGITLSTYQIIFLMGGLITLVYPLFVIFMRDGVKLVNGGIVVDPPARKQTGSFLDVMFKTSRKAAVDTVAIFRQVITEKPFWIFIGMVGLLVFAKLIFYHFHFTFPKYGIRVLGSGQKIGSIFGVLNPVMIIFLTPLCAALTKKSSSYKIMMIGTFISASAIFVAALPERLFVPLVNTWFGELVFVRWLEVPEDMRNPLFLALVIMVMIMTVGEALWSPRLMHFTAVIAPEGKEGSYIALSYLPYFGAKMIAGPLSGWLLVSYVPEGQASYPQHFMVWVWIGGMALVSPLGLLALRKLFAGAETHGVDKAH